MPQTNRINFELDCYINIQIKFGKANIPKIPETILRNINME